MTSLLDWLSSCRVCPNSCGIDRTRGRTGRCRLDAVIAVSTIDLHFGEESCLVGLGGSGTVFLTACNLACVFCQNSEISQLDRGKIISASDLIRQMFALQARGAENINFVSPTHQAPQVFEAVRQAKKEGLRLPVVYNSGGYENPVFLRALEGLVDIYMPDFKYGGDEEAETYSGVRKYTQFCKASLREMHRQVGDLRINARGTAENGLLVRHLVLPGGLARSEAVVDFLVSEISPNTYLNVMDQYRPAYRADEFPRLKRRVTRSEVESVAAYALDSGMNRVLF